MRLERLTFNKIKIFLTTDDLSERGLTKEDIWKDSLKWHQLFHEMLEEASVEFGVDIHGTVAVEIFTMHTQGMVMIITMNEQEEDTPFHDSFYDEMGTLDHYQILNEFASFEDLIQAAYCLGNVDYFDGSVYVYNNKYYYFIDHLLEDEASRVSVVLSEFSQPTLLSIHVVQEYGKEIISENAVETLIHYFK